MELSMVLDHCNHPQKWLMALQVEHWVDPKVPKGSQSKLIRNFKSVKQCVMTIIHFPKSSKQRCCEARAVVIRNHTNTQLDWVALSHRTTVPLPFFLNPLGGLHSLVISTSWWYTNILPLRLVSLGWLTNGKKMLQMCDRQDSDWQWPGWIFWCDCLVHDSFFYCIETGKHLNREGIWAS